MKRVLVAWLLTSGCSFIVDDRVHQCRFDSDCARFPAATCDPTQWICVASERAAGAAGSIGGQGGTAGSGETPDAAAAPNEVPLCRVANGRKGCEPCTPAEATNRANSCTDVTCVPFDSARIGYRTSDGKPRPLPPLPDAGDAT